MAAEAGRRQGRRQGQAARAPRAEIDPRGSSPPRSRTWSSRSRPSWPRPPRPTPRPATDDDFEWDDEESEALKQARRDAELTASADSVRAYLKQIGKVPLLNAEQEVELAKRIEAGLYAAERLRAADEGEEKLVRDCSAT